MRCDRACGGALRIAFVLLAASSCISHGAWPGYDGLRAHGRATAPGTAAFALVCGVARRSGPLAADGSGGGGGIGGPLVCARPSRASWLRAGGLTLQLCAPVDAGLQGLTYAFEQDGAPGRRSRTAWSPLQHPALVGKAVLQFHQKTRANLTAICDRVLDADPSQSSTEIRSELAMLASLIDQETAMRKEIAASAQLVFDSSPLRRTRTLHVDDTPRSRQALEAWLGGSETLLHSSSALSGSELRRIVDDCRAWQQSKHWEEQSVLLPLLAFACLKNLAACRANLDGRSRAEIAAVGPWLVTRAALSLPDAAQWRQHRIAEGMTDRISAFGKHLSSYSTYDPGGNLRFCSSTAGLLRHELLELSRLISLLRCC